MAEYHERRTDSDRLTRLEVTVESLADTTKSVLNKLDKHAEKMGLADGLNEKVTQTASDVRAVKHDVNNLKHMIEQALNVGNILSDKLKETQQKVAVLETKADEFSQYKATHIQEAKDGMEKFTILTSTHTAGIAAIEKEILDLKAKNTANEAKGMAYGKMGALAVSLIGIISGAVGFLVVGALDHRYGLEAKLVTPIEQKK